MKRRAKYVFLSWLRTLVNKLYPDYATNSYQYDNMEEAMEIWRGIYADEPHGVKTVTVKRSTSELR